MRSVQRSLLLAGPVAPGKPVTPRAPSARGAEGRRLSGGRGDTRSRFPRNGLRSHGHTCQEPRPCTAPESPAPQELEAERPAAAQTHGCETPRADSRGTSAGSSAVLELNFKSRAVVIMGILTENVDLQRSRVLIGWLACLARLSLSPSLSPYMEFLLASPSIVSLGCENAGGLEGGC